MPDFFLTVRNAMDNDTFGDDAAEMSYLIIGEQDTAIRPSDDKGKDDWLQQLIGVVQSRASPDPHPAFNMDILIYIHGYNDSENDILTNHRLVKNGLIAQGFTGEVVSFDWPCGDKAIAYLGDRHKAKMTAMELVDGGIMMLAAQQNNHCTINVHVLAHSTGAFVVREAFTDAKDSNKLPISDWMISQLVFISGDISSTSMTIHSACDALYAHCVRFTNYHNPYDAALALSNVKRLGFENRVGRVGLPANVPDKCADVDCGPYYQTICAGKPLFYSHSWYFGDALFMNDLYHTLTGNTDKNYLATRKLTGDKLTLVKLG